MTEYQVEAIDHGTLANNIKTQLLFLSNNDNLVLDDDYTALWKEQNKVVLSILERLYEEGIDEASRSEAISNIVASFIEISTPTELNQFIAVLRRAFDEVKDNAESDEKKYFVNSLYGMSAIVRDAIKSQELIQEEDKLAA